MIAMLDLYNRYSHGYLSIPIILTLKARNVFNILQDEAGITLDKLEKKLNANSGHLAVALRQLQALQWLRYNYRENSFSLTKEAEQHKHIPDFLMDLYRLDMDTFLRTGEGCDSVEQAINQSIKNWGITDKVLSDFLDGVIILPLFIALHKIDYVKKVENGHVLVFTGIKELDKKITDLLNGLFLSKKWAKENKEKIELNNKGKYVIEHILVTGVLASYRPMLANMDSVLFGNCLDVFGRDKDGHELHIDRTLNVISSGYQHEKYFQQIEECLMHIFTHREFSKQPKYVADMGCGDGSLLKRVYDTIEKKTERGKALKSHPLILIGADYNEKALDAAGSTLANMPHLMIKGDIGRPDLLIQDLRDKHSIDPADILHIRSFLDHNRPFLVPQNKDAAIKRPCRDYHGVYVDANGAQIPAQTMMQNLVEHLQRWADIITGHGLILLEVHCLGPDTAYTYMDECESLNFDPCHSFSGQYLAEADVFQLAAAESGLFAAGGFLKKFPRVFPYSRITLTHFERRLYTIRNASPVDLDSLVKLEHAWPEHLRVSAEEILARLELFPEGQCVVEINGEIKAAIYSQRIASIDSLRNAKYANLKDLASSQGAVIQLLTVNVLPEEQNKGYGDQLLEFMLDYCSLKDGIESITGITRCKDFAAHPEMTYDDYIDMVNLNGHRSDPILRFHQLHGAQFDGIVRDFRPEDVGNQGNGILIRYDLKKRKELKNKLTALNKTDKQEASSVGYENRDIRSMVEEWIRFLLGNHRIHAYDNNRPLLEMGLDSVDLMELRTLIKQNFSIDVGATFFFDHVNTEGIIKYFESRFKVKENETQVKQAVINKEEGLNTKGKHAADKSKIEGKSAVKKKRAKSDTHPEDIAIIGMSANFPQSENLDEFWNNLLANKNMVTAIPGDRFGDSSPALRNETYSKWGGFIKDVRGFDAAFYNISPREAEVMDPQQRLLLQEVWHTFEDANYPVSCFSGKRVGVFIGIYSSEYNDLLIEHGFDFDIYGILGIDFSIVANRVSYLLNLRGPSMTINTACSSSIVALDQAIKAIRYDDCEAAIAGGVNLCLLPRRFVSFSNTGMLAMDGRCKTFDKDADGYVRGEGFGTVLLKKLSRAIEDNDHIYAIVKSSEVDHAGFASSLTAPNPESQAELIMRAHEKSGFSPDTITYIEAHGTGTKLGDPVEIEGLKRAFAGLYKKKGLPMASKPTCGIGSVKTNIGHLESAAGIAGLIKVVLAMKHGIIPANLHFKELNPFIDFSDTPFYIVKENTAWDRIKADGIEIPRRAGLSSFGYGGVGGHVVLEEYMQDAQEENTACMTENIFILSAKNSSALKEYARRLMLFLENIASHNAENQYSLLERVLFSLQIGRESMDERFAFVTSSIEDTIKKLRQHCEAKSNIAGLLRGNIKTTRQNLNLLLNIQAGETYIETIMANKNLEQIASLWIMGYAVDWKKLYAVSPSKISLPGYPFEKTPYWLPLAEKKKKSGDEQLTERSATRYAQNNAAIERSLAKNESDAAIIASDYPEVEYFTTIWVKSELDKNTIITDKKTKNILLFDKDESLLHALKLYEKNLSVTLIKQGNGYKKITNNIYAINPIIENDFIKLAETLVADASDIDSIIMNWTTNAFGRDIKSLEADIQSGILSTFLLVKSLINTQVVKKNKLQILVLSSSGNVIQAQNWGHAGFFTFLREESSRIKGKVVDIAPERMNDIASIILHEMSDIGIDLVRYKTDGRYVRKYEELNIANNDYKSDSEFREQGVYIITGGAGALGLIIADYLTKKYRARIVLCGRSACDDSIRTKLSTLAMHGADARYVQTDVASLEDVTMLIDYCKLEFGAINGIIHSAGILNDALIINKKLENFQKVLKPKINGTINIDEACKNENLDFFMIFSSIATVIGFTGQSDYSFANSFLDAYAEYREEQRKQGKRLGRTITINWPYWKEGGMTLPEENSRHWIKYFGIYPMLTEHGIRAFVNAITSGRNNFIVIPGIGEIIKKSLYTIHASSKPVVPHDINQRNAAFVHEEKTEQHRPVELNKATIKEKLMIFMKSQIAAILKVKIENINEHEDFMTYGFESISLTKFINSMNDGLHTTLSIAVLLEHQTLHEFNNFLCDEYNHEVTLSVMKALNLRSGAKTEVYAQAGSMQGLSQGSSHVKDNQQIDMVQGQSEDQAAAIRNYLVACVFEILKIRPEDIDIHKKIFDLGFESISLTKLVNKLQEEIEIDLKVTALIDCETIDALSHYLLAEYPEEVQEFLLKINGNILSNEVAPYFQFKKSVLKSKLEHRSNTIVENGLTIINDTVIIDDYIHIPFRYYINGADLTPLILFQGILMDYNAFNFIFNNDEIRKKCNILIFEMRGLFKSTKFKSVDEKYVIHENSHYLFEILKHLNIDNKKFGVMGISYGALIATNFAFHYPKNVSFILLVSAPASEDKTEIIKMQSYIKLVNGLYEKHQNKYSIHAIDMFFFKLFSFDYLIKNDEFVLFLRSRIEQALEKYPDLLLSLMKIFEAVIDAEEFAHANKLAFVDMGIPLRLIEAEMDAMLSTIEAVRIIKSMNGDFEIVKNAGHNLFIEDEGYFISKIVEFIDHVNNDNYSERRHSAREAVVVPAVLRVEQDDIRIPGTVLNITRGIKMGCLFNVNEAEIEAFDYSALNEKTVYIEMLIPVKRILKGKVKWITKARIFKDLGIGDLVIITE